MHVTEKKEALFTKRQENILTFVTQPWLNIRIE